MNNQDLLKKITAAFAVFCVFSFNHNSFPLRNWDEAWYGEIIKNMSSGQYSFLVPFWNGQYYFDKPPLYFWLSLPVVKLFGLGEWQIRFISIAASTISTLLVYLIAKKLWNKRVAVFSPVIFVTLGQVYVRFSHGNLDALLVTLFLATYYFWLKGVDNKKLYFASGICLGLGFLVKGWALGLFPLFVITLHSLILEKRVLPRNILYIIVCALLSSGWWFILGAMTFGKPFSNWYIFTIAEGVLSKQTNVFSLEPLTYFLRDIGLWWIIIVMCFAKLRKYNKTIIFLALISFLFLFFLSFAQEKLDWHNLPTYPYVAVLIGFSASQLFEKHGKVFLISFFFLVFAQVFIVYKIENIYPDRSKAGATLGFFAKNVINNDKTVVLDDHDFTSFLYYSNLKKIYVLEKIGGKPGEFWVIKKDEFDLFAKKHKNILLISKHPEEVVKNYNEKNIVRVFEDYKFLRI